MPNSLLREFPYSWDALWRKWRVLLHSLLSIWSAINSLLWQKSIVNDFDAHSTTPPSYTYIIQYIHGFWRIHVQVDEPHIFPPLPVYIWSNSTAFHWWLLLFLFVFFLFPFARPTQLQKNMRSGPMDQINDSYLSFPSNNVSPLPLVGCYVHCLGRPLEPRGEDPSPVRSTGMLLVDTKTTTTIRLGRPRDQYSLSIMHTLRWFERRG